MRTLSDAEEAAQGGDDGVGTLPRDAMRGAGDDRERAIRHSRRGELRLRDVLRVARAGDPERRDFQFMEARKGRGHVLPQLARELGAIEILLPARHDVAAEERLGVPVAHERFPIAARETLRPIFARSFGGADARGDEDRGFVLRAVEERLQREAAASRVAEKHVAARLELRHDVEAGVPQKVPVARRAEKAVQRGDHHSASYFAQARALAAASGSNSVTRSSMRHIFAHCSKWTSCTFSMSVRSMAASDATREKIRPPPLLTMTISKRSSGGSCATIHGALRS